ncbi:hypothetical protein ACFWWA_26620 [Streptomyces goshikiensis]|uniref:hypothetical protein n=1 Tax=Streptomyces goshikiensis TaxID=1942 RepID=UPI00365085B0
MLSRILTFGAAFMILVVVNKYLIGPLWGELVFTAVIAGGATYLLGRLERGARTSHP